MVLKIVRKSCVFQNNALCCAEEYRHEKAKTREEPKDWWALHRKGRQSMDSNEAVSSWESGYKPRSSLALSGLQYNTVCSMNIVTPKCSWDHDCASTWRSWTLCAVDSTLSQTVTPNDSLLITYIIDSSLQAEACHQSRLYQTQLARCGICHRIKWHTSAMRIPVE
jgi:hypothetical protein